ncbi:MAG: thermonuclease family protein [Bdellovibrionota bacterium]
MKNTSLALVIFLLAFTACKSADKVMVVPNDGNTYYEVERVVDGDTIEVETIGKVRLIGLDTPETVDPRKPVEYFGKEASQFLTRLVLHEKVRLEYDQTKTDKYKRTLAYVYMADGTFVNAEIIKQGYGFAYTKFPFKYLEQFRAYEKEAREDKRGLWAPRKY